MVLWLFFLAVFFAGYFKKVDDSANPPRITLRLDAYYHLKKREQELWEKLGRAEVQPCGTCRRSGPSGHQLVLDVWVGPGSKMGGTGAKHHKMWFFDFNSSIWWGKWWWTLKFLEGQPWLREQDLTDVTDIEIRRFEVAAWLRKLGHAWKCGNRTSLVSLRVDVLADGLFKFVHHF